MKGMILAAGLGARMRPLTEHTPKPLLKVGGKPLIVWHIEALRAANVREIVINTAWLGHKLEKALGDGRALGVNIHWSHEPDGHPLETAGGIIQALPLLGRDPFLLVNGDIWLRKFFSPLKRALAPGRQAHLVLVDNPEHNPRGDFLLACGDAAPEAGVRHAVAPVPDTIDLLPQPPGAVAAGQRLTYAGLAVYCPSLFQGLPAGVRPLAPLLREAIAAGRVGGEYFPGPWVDVGTPQRLQDLDAAIMAGSI
ncbi:nucleotidyltransferase family protein [Amnimonas aquatica]|uniref:Nucleotidyl transferase domain-containing protein n=1 Tax=Amnimonas aquatica TaxID=2094561 RepID=A0A2P6ATR1_9GAMM|nr:nucleotidyltransferase family protein [Amnimonas aquatica]PQA47986.1 hypothetical protein C5O18_03655 [Amnimonas aquatica]